MSVLANDTRIVSTREALDRVTSQASFFDNVVVRTLDAYQTLFLSFATEFCARALEKMLSSRGIMLIPAITLDCFFCMFGFVTAVKITMIKVVLIIAHNSTRPVTPPGPGSTKRQSMNINKIGAVELIDFIDFLIPADVAEHVVIGFGVIPKNSVYHLDDETLQLEFQKHGYKSVQQLVLFDNTEGSRGYRNVLFDAFYAVHTDGFHSLVLSAIFGPLGLLEAVSSAHWNNGSFEPTNGLSTEWCTLSSFVKKEVDENYLSAYRTRLSAAQESAEFNGCISGSIDSTIGYGQYWSNSIGGVNGDCNC